MTTSPAVSPWRFVLAFGVISLLADFVYEGARSVTGPYLASLGASATLVGLVTGVGEAFAFAGRLFSGPLTDRTRAYWPLTFAGYALTVASVPLLGFTNALLLASLLVVAERAGKALRSPAKDVLLSHAAAAVGRGRGFAVHEALDQTGAIAGPLAVAGILAFSGGSYSWAFWALAIPGVAVMLLLVRLRFSVPDPSHYETVHEQLSSQPQERESPRLPPAFWTYLTFTVVTTSGYATFGVLSFHLATKNVVAVATIPVIYALAMAVDAVSAVATGWLYDHSGRITLIAVPVLSALIPLLAFRESATAAITGVLLWGAVMGIQESTMRAAVADLVPIARRGTAYGVFAGGFGLATLLGSVLVGALYSYSVTATIIVVGAIQVVALLLLLIMHSRRGTRATAA